MVIIELYIYWGIIIWFNSIITLFCNWNGRNNFDNLLCYHSLVYFYVKKNLQTLLLCQVEMGENNGMNNYEQLKINLLNKHQLQL